MSACILVVQVLYTYVRVHAAREQDILLTEKTAYFVALHIFEQLHCFMLNSFI